MHRLELLGMVMRHVLVPMGLELRTRTAPSSLTLQEVVDLGWLVHGFSAHKIVTELGIAMLVMWQTDHVLVHGCWRMIHNCRVYRSAQFLNTDHRLVVPTLKLQLKSGRMVPSQPRLDVGKLKDERVAEEFANRLNGDLGGLGALGDPKELWSAFKTTILDVAGKCLGTHRRAKKNFDSQGALDAIGQRHRARLNGRAELFRELRRKTVHALRVDKETYVRESVRG